MIQFGCSFLERGIKMLYIAISIVVYALINNVDKWYHTYKWYKLNFNRDLNAVS